MYYVLCFLARVEEVSIAWFWWQWRSFLGFQKQPILGIKCLFLWCSDFPITLEKIYNIRDACSTADIIDCVANNWYCWSADPWRKLWGCGHSVFGHLGFEGLGFGAFVVTDIWGFWTFGFLDPKLRTSEKPWTSKTGPWMSEPLMSKNGP